MPSFRDTPVPQAEQRAVSGFSSTGSGRSSISSTPVLLSSWISGSIPTSDSVIVLVELVAAFGANVGVGRQVSITVWTREGEFGTTVGASLILLVQRAAAIWTQIDAARRAL
jgi:hypothetical protein